MAKSASMNVKKEDHPRVSVAEPSSSFTEDIKDKRYSLNDEHGASTSFRNIGFCKWGKDKEDWLPIIQLGPMDVEPGSVRDMWYDMYYTVSCLFFVFLCISCVHIYCNLKLNLYAVFMFIAISPYDICIYHCRARRVAVQ